MLGREAAANLHEICAKLLDEQVVFSGQTTLWSRRLTPELLGEGERGLPLQRPLVAQLLQDAGLSNGEVAAALDTTTVTVSRWRARRAVPPVTSAIRLAAFVGVPVEAIEWRPNAEIEYETARPPVELTAEGKIRERGLPLGNMMLD